MSEIINVLTKETAERLTTNRNSPKKHIDIYLMRGRRMVIEGCENHKYCYWLSKQKVDEIETNADVLLVTMYEEYDYVGYSVYLYPKLHLSQQDVLDGYKVTIEKVIGVDGVSFKAPWGTDSTGKSNEENGMFMAKGLAAYYEELLAKCKAAETSNEVLGHFDLIEKTLETLTGDKEKDFAKTRKLIEPMWKWTYFRLSDNEKFRLRYERLFSNLSHIYNAHMSMAR